VDETVTNCIKFTNGKSVEAIGQHHGEGKKQPRRGELSSKKMEPKNLKRHKGNATKRRIESYEMGRREKRNSGESNQPKTLGEGLLKGRKNL
jgi:hypothetical protein